MSNWAFRLLMIFLILFPVTSPVVTVMLLWRWRRRLAVGFIAVYIAIYVLLSMQGQYIEYIGGGADGSKVWYPLGCNNTQPSPVTRRIKTEPSPLGMYFGPLLWIDSTLIHRDSSH
ncbi:MAG: hypothetical protein ACYTG7_15345 [Planctomycetota bacterium]|jgi:cell division protein FtsW (lipid II flippase)